MGSRKLADDLCYPPRAMRADRAAAYLSMATSTFLNLVDEKRLPKGKRLRGMVFWDRAELDSFVENYEGEADEATTEDKWAKILEG
jgi:predicted DNA-binding transcriptional regulator AlpA